MAETTKIEWADATFNGWIGCTKVSPACANCYAATYGNRFGVKWGKGNPRRRTSEAKWREPIAWNRKAEREGTRPRVFCSSLADWLDDEVPARWLADLLALIARTPALTWMLLTKRPELWRARIGAALADPSPDEPDRAGFERCLREWLDGTAHPKNVWIGCTAEDQKRADERLAHLVAIPAEIRFLSCEPLLGPIYLSKMKVRCGRCFLFADNTIGGGHTLLGPRDGHHGVHWIIAGGESGPGARPSHPDWFRSLRNQAQLHRAAFHFKQWGEWGDGELHERWTDDLGHEAVDDTNGCQRVGKKVAGREIDGRTWDEFPQ